MSDKEVISPVTPAPLGEAITAAVVYNCSCTNL